MGSMSRKETPDAHAVTKRCEMPAALTEVGFITNPTEVVETALPTNINIKLLKVLPRE